MEAIKWGEKCIKLTDRSGVGDDTSQDRILVAYCFYMLKNYSKALEYAEDAEKMATRAGNVRDMALANKVMGDIFREMDEESKIKSLEYYMRSLELYEKLGDKNQIAKLKYIIQTYSF